MCRLPKTNLEGGHACLLDPFPAYFGDMFGVQVDLGSLLVAESSRMSFQAWPKLRRSMLQAGRERFVGSNAPGRPRRVLSGPAFGRKGAAQGPRGG